MRRVFRGAAIALIAVAFAPVAHADNTTATDAQFIRLGQTRSCILDSLAQERWYKTRLVAGRSYAAEAWAPEAEASTQFVSLDVTWYLGATTVATGIHTTTKEPRPVVTSHNGDQETIIPDAAQCPSANGCTYSVRVRSFSPLSVTTPIRLQVVETTLTSPYWQVVTGAGYDAAPQVRNNVSESLPVVLTLHDASGTAACTLSPTIAANGLYTVSLASACGVSTGFGTAQIAHHGPPGSVAGNITTFSGMSGLSFDAPFSPRNGWTSLGVD